MKKASAILAGSLVGMISAHGALLVFEDFDYAQAQFASGTFGGGTGFAAESTWSNTGNGGINQYIFDGTPDGTPLLGETWDGVFNGLPSSPNHAGINVTGGSHLYLTRALDTAALAPHLADGQTLWMSWVANGGGNGNRRTGLVLSSGPPLRERAQSLDGGAGAALFPAQAAGATTYHAAPSTYSSNMHPVAFDQPTTTNVSQINGGVANNSGSLTAGDHLMIVKFEWNADNAQPDTISLYNLSEPAPETTDLSSVITEADFDLNKKILTKVLNQTDFDTLAGMSVHGFAHFDQIRVGTTFNDVIGLASGPGATFRLTITRNDPNLDFEWTSQAGKLYRLRSSADLSTDFATWNLLAEDLPNTAPNGSHSLAQPGDPTLFYRMEEYPAPPITHLSANFEAGPDGFTVVDHSAGETGSDWAQGDPDSTGLGGSITTGNGGAGNCFGTDIGNPGFYVTATDACLRSPVIDLTAVSEATLKFAEALDVESADTAVVNIIEETTDTVIAAAIRTSTPDANTGTANWTTVGPIAIPPAAIGQKVRIEWRFTGNGGASFDYMGWYIDDVEVTSPAP